MDERICVHPNQNVIQQCSLGGTVTLCQNYVEILKVCKADAVFEARVNMVVGTKDFRVRHLFFVIW